MTMIMIIIKTRGLRSEQNSSEDVVLDLAGAAVDRRGAAVQVLGGGRPRVLRAHGRLVGAKAEGFALIRRRVVAERFEPQLGDVLQQMADGELEARGGGVAD